MLCDCNQMRSCCTRIIDDGPSLCNFQEWYLHSYWYTENQKQHTGECVHIQACRQHLAWSNPFLQSPPLQWDQPIPAVVLYCKIPVLSMCNENSDSVLRSRVFIKRRGRKFFCSKCKPASGCAHVQKWQQEEDENSNKVVRFLPTDIQEQSDDTNIRCAIESGEPLIMPDGTLKRCVQVTIPLHPREDFLVHVNMQPATERICYYAEDQAELVRIGGARLAHCNLCNSPWGDEFAEPTEKKLYTRRYSTTVNGVFPC